MVCKNCKKAFWIKPKSRPAKYCSVSCKEAQRYQRHKELARHWHSPGEIVEAAWRVMGEIDLGQQRSGSPDHQGQAVLYGQRESLEPAGSGLVRRMADLRRGLLSPKLAQRM